MSGNATAKMLAAGKASAARSEPAKVEAVPSSETTAPVVESTRQPVSQYVKIGVFVTPDQRHWLRSTLRDLDLDGISASDLVRLALTRLQDEPGQQLATALIDQAHREAEQFPGRKNRGMPAL